ncbi:hypothetical protein P280DRAFT_464980 [Massarina eburnea CBS 473.64]|uniref:Major facilitator superfamily (MFS) profile domain-containing protein n=1 Tax=Massarina eburnea CBS 473.64 TaxID=1395130 RepID=A0A6A6SGC4_9PLEO|nr:hypothetical protein P280DRAFT_464980 [Massarina eburnea CBS 473.64]
MHMRVYLQFSNCKNAVSISGRIIYGGIGDVVGLMNTVSIAGIISGLSILAFWLPVEMSRRTPVMRQSWHLLHSTAFK